MIKNVCKECRYYLPSLKTFYHKPTGYCGNPRVEKPCRGLAKACALFEADKVGKKESRASP